MIDRIAALCCNSCKGEGLAHPGGNTRPCPHCQRQLYGDNQELERLRRTQAAEEERLRRMGKAR